MQITSRFIPRVQLDILVREASVKARTRPEWEAALDEIESFCKLTPEETAWLAGVRYFGCYTRPFV